MNPNILNIVLINLSLLLIIQGMYLPKSLIFVLFVMLIGLWQAHKRRKPFSKYALLYVLTAFGLFFIYLDTKTLLGIQAGVAVLTTFLFAKTHEIKKTRDLIIVFNFAMFVAASTFLFDQSFFMALGVFLCLVSSLIGLYRVQLAAFEKPDHRISSNFKSDFMHVAKFISLAFPFFVVLFIFFPRIPPLWHVPLSNNQAVTGMSDRMSPGDIASLSQSNALAFRILGNMEKLPPRKDLYWRGLVLDQYDGRTWTSHPSNSQAIREKIIRTSNNTWAYHYLAIDANQDWIMGLDQSLPIAKGYYARKDYGISAYRSNNRNTPIALAWLGTSYTSGYQQQQMFSKLNLQYPAHLNASAQALAQRIFKESQANPQRYVKNVLQWFQQQSFVYTLTPGRLGQQVIDEFLFESKQGFCEHYATSFVMLMRYAGIPARVVVGYQGGDFAPDRKSWEVRQLDAHAWAEVILDRKWVRVDPTAMIAPQRVSESMQNLVQHDVNVLGNDGDWARKKIRLMTNFRIWSDYATYQWQSKIVGYDVNSQQAWLSKFGLNSSYSLGIVLMTGILSLVGIYLIGYWLLARSKLSQEQILIMRFNRNLPLALQRQTHETFRAWIMRLESKTDLTNDIHFQTLIELYECIYYQSQTPEKSDVLKFKSLLKTCSNILKKR